MSKEAYYFSHDANARHDPKILFMRGEYGIKGYGIYWLIIEMLRESEDFKLKKKALTYNAIAMQVQCKDFAKDDAKQFVEFCINDAELFEEDEEFFWSNSLLKRMEKKKDLSKKRSEAANKRWRKSDDGGVSEKEEDANAMQVHANAKQNDARKGKERKGKESKENKKEYADHVTLTPSEYEKLIEKFGEEDAKERIERLSLYKGSKGKKYKSDYMTILAWAKRDEKKVNIGTHTKQNKIDWDEI